MQFKHFISRIDNTIFTNFFQSIYRGHVFRSQTKIINTVNCKNIRNIYSVVYFKYISLKYKKLIIVI